MSPTGVASGAANLLEEEAVKPKGGAKQVVLKHRHFQVLVNMLSLKETKVLRSRCNAKKT